MQTALGPRVPGTEANAALRAELEARLSAATSEVHVQGFDVSFHGRRVRCANIVGTFRSGSGGGAVLLGTHFDTRPIADREPDPASRARPIPGANDGGSGTAIFLHMLERLSEDPPPRDVIIAFLDAEDLGNIDGNPFSLGAEYLASHPVPGAPPVAEAIVLDMVGGKDMVLDVDAHACLHPPSRMLTERVFRTGVDAKAAPFTRTKPGRLKYIVSDHWPFMRRGIPSCILIDIDYPEWHTTADLQEAMSGDSLRAIEEVVSLYLWRPQG
jgi:glutaminyl-peptide cyclotransferase